MNLDKIKNICSLVMKDIANFSPYFLFLYIFVFVMSLFFSPWLSFWKNIVLHISFIIFGLVFILKKIKTLYMGEFSLENIKKFWIQILKKINLKIQREDFSRSFFKIKNFLKTFISRKNMSRFFKNVYLLISRFIFFLICWTKFFVPIILIFLGNALKSFWRKIKNGFFISWTGGFAFFFLVLCPFLLMFKKDAMAENSAVYAYNFLVIWVILMIIGSFFDKNNKGHQNIEE